MTVLDGGSLVAPASRLRTNFLLNVGGMVLPLGTALLTVPLYIDTVGAARYGILSVVWILLGYFGFLDFGLSRASANALSRLGHASPAERTPVLVTSLYLNTGLGLAGGVVLYAASSLILGRFAHLSPELTAEVEAAMPWIACMLPVAMVSGVAAGALESRERFLTTNVLTTLGGVLGQVVPVLCALLIAPTLAVVIPAALFTRVACTVLIWVIVVRGERPVSLRSFDRTKVRELMGYGAWVSVTSVISPLMETFDQILIGALLGPAAIAHYSVPMSLSTRMLMISNALSKTLFPRLSRLPPAAAKLLAKQAIVTMAYGFAAICGPAVILAQPMLRLWIGPEFAAPSAPVAQILLLGAWANGVAIVPYTLLLGQGRPDLTAKIHAIEVLPFLALLWVLMTTLGLPGAALAWALRTGIDGLALMFVSGNWDRGLLRALPAVLLMAGCWAIAWFVPLTAIQALGAAVAAGLLAVGLGLLADATLRAELGRLVPRRARPAGSGT